MVPYLEIHLWACTQKQFNTRLPLLPTDNTSYRVTSRAAEPKICDALTAESYETVSDCLHHFLFSEHMSTVVHLMYVFVLCNPGQSGHQSHIRLCMTRIDTLGQQLSRFGVNGDEYVQPQKTPDHRKTPVWDPRHRPV